METRMDRKTRKTHKKEFSSAVSRLLVYILSESVKPVYKLL